MNEPTRHTIEATRTPRGSLMISWPTDAGNDNRLISRIADQLKEHMADRGIKRIVITVEIQTA